MKYKVMLFCIFVFVVSCKESTNTNDYVLNVDRNNSIYHPDNYIIQPCCSYNKEIGILRRKLEKYDIIPTVSIENTITMEMYNYGKDLGAKWATDSYISSCLYSKVTYFTIQTDEISDAVLSPSFTYGDMCRCNIRSKKIIANNVMCSPLATEFIYSKSYNDKGSLIYVKIEDEIFNGGYVEYVFLGDYVVQDLIDNHYEVIRDTD